MIITNVTMIIVSRTTLALEETRACVSQHIDQMPDMSDKSPISVTIHHITPGNTWSEIKEIITEALSNTVPNKLYCSVRDDINPESLFHARFDSLLDELTLKVPRADATQAGVQ